MANETVDKSERLVKSELLAHYIKEVNRSVLLMDEEHLEWSVKEMADAAMAYDSMAVLNRNYSVEKSDIRKHQAKMISLLSKYKKAQTELLELFKVSEAAKANEEILKNIFGE